jgi:hypothetical protein
MLVEKEMHKAEQEGRDIDPQRWDVLRWRREDNMGPLGVQIFVVAMADSSVFSCTSKSWSSGSQSGFQFNLLAH